eukprot:1028952-Prorocentrum_minimum.AAC.1
MLGRRIAFIGDASVGLIVSYAHQTVGRPVLTEKSTYRRRNKHKGRRFLRTKITKGHQRVYMGRL